MDEGAQIGGSVVGPLPPKDGDWPCQTTAQPTRERLVAVLYRLMRDHVPTGVIEQLLLDIRDEEEFDFTNPHLEALARALATRIVFPTARRES